MRTNDSALPKKPTGHLHNIRTPENAEQVQASIIQYLRHSARKHSAAQGISDRAMRQILHANLQMVF